MPAIRPVATSSLLGVDDATPATMRMSSAALRPSLAMDLVVDSHGGIGYCSRTASATSRA